MLTKWRWVFNCCLLQANKKRPLRRGNILFFSVNNPASMFGSAPQRCRNLFSLFCDYYYYYRVVIVAAVFPPVMQMSHFHDNARHQIHRAVETLALFYKNCFLLKFLTKKLYSFRGMLLFLRWNNSRLISRSQTWASSGSRTKFCTFFHSFSLNTSWVL